MNDNMLNESEILLCTKKEGEVKVEIQEPPLGQRHAAAPTFVNITFSLNNKLKITKGPSPRRALCWLRKKTIISRLRKYH